MVDVVQCAKDIFQNLLDKIVGGGLVFFLTVECHAEYAHELRPPTNVATCRMLQITDFKCLMLSRNSKKKTKMCGW